MRHTKSRLQSVLWKSYIVCCTSVTRHVTVSRYKGVRGGSSYWNVVEGLEDAVKDEDPDEDVTL